MIRNLFLLVAIIATACTLFGCGTDGVTSSPSEGGLIIGGSETLEITPEVGIYKTTITKGDSTETSFHLETNLPVARDLVVYVTYDNGESGEFIVIRAGEHQSEAFEFMVDDDDISTVTVAPDSERVKVSLPKLAKNVGTRIEVTVDYNFKKYPYMVKTDDSSVSR